MIIPYVSKIALVKSNTEVFAGLTGFFSSVSIWRRTKLSIFLSLPFINSQFLHVKMRSISRYPFSALYQTTLLGGCSRLGPYKIISCA